MWKVRQEKEASELKFKLEESCASAKSKELEETSVEPIRKAASALENTCQRTEIAMKEITQSFLPTEWQTVSQCFTMESWVGIQGFQKKKGSCSIRNNRREKNKLKAFKFFFALATQSGFLPSKQFFEKTRREKFCSKSFLMNAFKQGSKQSILKNAKDKISVNARVADFASLQMLQSGAKRSQVGEVKFDCQN